MPTSSQRLSIADVWDETALFVRREGGLMLPVAFSTIGLGSLLFALATPVAVADGGAAAMPVPGAWMLVMIPFLLLWVFGQLAIATMALRGGLTVREALGAAFGRMGGAVLAVLLVGVAVLLLLVLLSTVALAMVGADATRASALAMALALPFVAFLSVRLLPLFPVLADGAARAAPVTAVRTAFAATRGAFWRIFGASLLYILATSLIVGAVQLGLGSVLLLAGRQLGAEAGARTLVLVISALLSAGLQATWCVFTVMLYRRLGSPRQGI